MTAKTIKLNGWVEADGEVLQMDVVGWSRCDSPIPTRITVVCGGRAPPGVRTVQRNQDLQDRLAAGHRYRRPRNIARKRIGQHDVGRCQLRWLAGTFHRHILPEFFTASSFIVDGISGVQIGPGATALARMPFSARSCARPAVKF